MLTCNEVLQAGRGQSRGRRRARFRPPATPQLMMTGEAGLAFLLDLPKATALRMATPRLAGSVKIHPLAAQRLPTSGRSVSTQ